jgi:hypothetical protein
MSYPSATPEERFATIVESLRSQPNVTQASEVIESTKRFGANALKVNAKIFAMLVNGHLVVKLPRQRVDDLIAAGAGERFAPGHGRQMKEWLSVEPTAEGDWLPLAREAMAFVDSNNV